MNIKSQKDFFAGLTYLVIGAAFAWGATTYSVGQGARMGPGYFPLMLGIVLALLGTVIGVKALVVDVPDGDKVSRWVWRPVFFIVAANIAFGVLLGGLPSIKLPACGLVAAIYALVLISAQAANTFKLKEVLILSTILAAGSYVVFILVLKLQIQVWPAFITG